MTSKRKKIASISYAHPHLFAKHFSSEVLEPRSFVRSLALALLLYVSYIHTIQIYQCMYCVCAECVHILYIYISGFRRFFRSARKIPFFFSFPSIDSDGSFAFPPFFSVPFHAIPFHFISLLVEALTLLRSIRKRIHALFLITIVQVVIAAAGAVVVVVVVDACI